MNAAIRLGAIESALRAELAPALAARILTRAEQRPSSDRATALATTIDEVLLPAEIRRVVARAEQREIAGSR